MWIEGGNPPILHIKCSLLSMNFLKINKITRMISVPVNDPVESECFHEQKTLENASLDFLVQLLHTIR